MSATATTGETAEQTTPETKPSFTDWRPPEERGPTEEEKREARKRTLEIGNETAFEMKKVPKGKKALYERLDHHNRDCHWEYRDDITLSEDVDKQFKRGALYAMAAQLDLTRLQRQKALNRLFRLDLPRFGMRTDVVAFCLCGLVVNADAERYAANGDEVLFHPARSSENNPPLFARVQSQLIEVAGRTTQNYIQSVWGKLTQGDPPTRSEGEWKSVGQTNSPLHHKPSHRPKVFEPEELDR